MKQDKPIVRSRLDTDFYEFTQGDMIHKLHPDVPVELSFINRTKSIRLGEMIDLGELRENLEAYQTLPFTPGELHYLMGTYEYNRTMFRYEYGEFLKNLKKLPDFSIEVVDGQLNLRFYGPAAKVIYWEIPSMTIVKKLFIEALMKGFSRSQREAVEAEGRIRLANKIPILKEDPEIRVADFSTRRRFSFDHQRYCVGTMVDECGEMFTGTSNVLLAKEFEIMPIGTNSHKLPMIYMGIFWEQDNIDPTFSQRQVFKDWEDQHQLELSIFLTDTINSRWCVKNVISKDQIRRWKGFRHDSGSPFTYIDDRVINYTEGDIDPRKKIVLCADNLNVRKMRDIQNYSRGKIKTPFGWGTDFGCDIPIPQVSIVTKVTRSNDHEIAKISDNISKATGSKQAIDRLLDLTQVENNYAMECVS